jgi:hypothetical protein
MTLQQIIDRDARARTALVEYSRGQITEATARFSLGASGWSDANIDRVIRSVKQNLKLGGET